MGHGLFSWVADLSKYVHNFVGPVFVLCTILMFFTFLRRNFFNRTTGTGSSRAAADVAQACSDGLLQCRRKGLVLVRVVPAGPGYVVTGLILDFVTFGQTRYMLQVANILHIAGATMFMSRRWAISISARWVAGRLRAMRHGTSTKNGPRRTTKSGTKTSSMAGRRWRPSRHPAAGARARSRPLRSSMKASIF